jgi:dTMP kinase
VGGIIAICGIDGCGKTTLYNRLKNAYSLSTNIRFIKPFEIHPVTSELEHVAKRFDLERRDVFTNEIRCLSWMLDLLHTYRTIISPAIVHNNYIVLDRYLYSTLAFAHYYNCSNFDDISYLSHLLELPLITLYLNSDFHIAYHRICTRGKSLSPYEQEKNLSSLHQSYQIILQNQPHVYQIDANQDIECVFSSAYTIIQKQLENDL